MELTKNQRKALKKKARIQNRMAMNGLTVPRVGAETDSRLSEWVKGMKAVYLGGLAETYTLDVHGTRFATNEAVVATALPHIPREKWEEHFNAIAGFSRGTDLIPKLLQYFHTCEMNVSLGSLKPLLQACKLLGLDHLMEACQQYLWNVLGPHNYISWWRFGTEENIEGIRKRCVECLLKELNQVRKCQEFRELTLEQLVEFFTDQIKEGQTPDQLFRAALTWLESHDPKDAEVIFNIIAVSKCSKECLRVIAEPQYESIIWPTAALQSKLFRACLNAEPSKVNLPKETDLKVPKPKEDFEKETLLDLTYSANQKFALEMIKTFQEFQKTSKYVDITVTLEDRSVEAHATVLAAASPYFQSLLRFPPPLQDDRAPTEITLTASKRLENELQLPTERDDTIDSNQEDNPTAKPTIQEVNKVAENSLQEDKEVTTASKEEVETAPKEDIRSAEPTTQEDKAPGNLLAEDRIEKTFEKGEESPQENSPQKVLKESNEKEPPTYQTTDGANIRKTDLSHLEPTAVLTVLDYMYCRQISIPDKTLSDHIQASDFLGLDSLLDACKKHAETHARIEDDSCFQWISAHRSYNLPATRARAMEFACKNFERLIHNDGLLHLGSEDFIELLNNPLLAPVSEQTLFELLISWISCEQDTRRQCLSQMLDSKAMGQCVVCDDLDLKELLAAGSFDSSERDAIWETRYKNMRRVLKEELSIQESEVSRLKSQVINETSSRQVLTKKLSAQESEVSRLKNEVINADSERKVSKRALSIQESEISRLTNQLHFQEYKIPRLTNQLAFETSSRQRAEAKLSDLTKTEKNLRWNVDYYESRVKEKEQAYNKLVNAILLLCLAMGVIVCLLLLYWCLSYFYYWMFTTHGEGAMLDNIKDPGMDTSENPRLEYIAMGLCHPRA